MTFWDSVNPHINIELRNTTAAGVDRAITGLDGTPIASGGDHPTGRSGNWIVPDEISVIPAEANCAS